MKIKTEGKWMWEEPDQPNPATGEDTIQRGIDGRYIPCEPRLRFDTKWIPEPNTGCWLWTSNVAGNGYGQFRFDNRFRPAHRIAWLLFKGEIPKGMEVCHRCDTPLCVNPDHLFLGTHADNMNDAVAKGRKKKDPKNGRFTK